MQPDQVRRARECAASLEPLAVVAGAGNRFDHELVDDEVTGRQGPAARTVLRRVVDLAGGLFVGVTIRRNARARAERGIERWRSRSVRDPRFEGLPARG